MRENTAPRSDVEALPAIRGGARTTTVQPASSAQHDRRGRSRKGRPLRVYGALEGRFRLPSMVYGVYRTQNPSGVLAIGRAIGGDPGFTPH